MSAKSDVRSSTRPASRSELGDGERKSFALVLGGGGARGFAHLGVLRALDRQGLQPAAIVGVSMGAVVGAAYALCRDWYGGVLDFARRGFPRAARAAHGSSRLARLTSGAKTVWDLARGWGADPHDVMAGRDALRDLLGEADLRDGRLPLAVCATDLLSGSRVVLTEGPAVEAVYASGALTGVLPPQRIGPYLLADGAYSDICPVDVARGFGCDKVIAVHPGRAEVVDDIRNGLQGLVRATEICYLHHSALRFAEADVMLEPLFRRPVDTLDFSAHRECVAAGVRAVRANMAAITRSLYD